MKVIVEDLAKESILNIFSYNLRYSIKYATETNIDIQMFINDLIEYPFIGRYIPEMSDKRFREIIYKKNRHSGYRIMYLKKIIQFMFLTLLVVNKIFIVF